MENTKMPNGRDEMTEEFAQEHQPDGWAFWDGDRVVPCESYEAVVAAIRKAKGER